MFYHGSHQVLYLSPANPSLNKNVIIPTDSFGIIFFEAFFKNNIVLLNICNKILPVIAVFLTFWRGAEAP